MTVLFAGLTGCIQPVSNTDLTQTALAPFAAINTPIVTPVGANPAGSVANGGVPTPAPLAMILQFLQSQGDATTELQVWYDQPQQSDRLQGFSYSAISGSPCVGFVLTAFVNGFWQPNNGARVCAESPGVEALAAVTFFLTSDGQPYTIVFGRVENPAVSAIAVMYDDDVSQQANPLKGGFLLLRPGVVGVRVITAVNAEGNTVIPNIPQSPV